MINFQQSPLCIIAPSGYAPIARQQFWQTHTQALNLNIQNKDVLQRHDLRYGGTLTQRLQDFSLKTLAALPNHCIIMPVRGGYGLSQLIEQINWQALVDISVSKQLFWVGHSDFTLHHLIALKFGLNTYAGPMFISDLDHDVYSKFTWQSLYQQYMQFKGDPESIESFELNLPRLSENQEEEAITGRLWGGNLAMLSHLIGSRYMPSPAQIEQGLLFLEDIGEHPYKIDRMLHQLYQAGYLANQQAIMLGAFTNYQLTSYDQGFNLETVWQYWQAKLPHVRFVKDLAFGHIYDKLCLKIGHPYTLNTF